jgi:SAM-dependent methyltransferase
MSPLSDWRYSARLERVAKVARRTPGVSHAFAALDSRRSRQVERSGQAAERARSRWQAAEPAADLTWGVELSGDAFVDAVVAHGGLASGTSIVEIGPGYGRLPASILARGVELQRYVGVDLSEENVAHLRERFDDPRLSFEVGDAESVSLDEPADTLISSLTFKHFYPSFERALANLRSSLAPGATAAFDLIEGDRRYFQVDGRTYIHQYTRPEVEGILDRAGYRLRAFDEVVHDADHVRLLVVATPAGSPAE